MENKFRKLVLLTKIDEATHTVAGIAASELPDHDDEIWDYAYGKEAMQRWSNEILARTVAAGQEPSLGNIRVMHSLTIGGKVTKIEFKDDLKQVWIETQPVNDDIWQQLKRGLLNSFSIGGGYAWKKPEGKYQRYGADMSEISYVDAPCNPEAVFTFVRANGSVELRKFAPRDPNKAMADAVEAGRQAAEAFSSVLDKTRNPTGQFSVQNSGETHDFLVASGYNHERTGSTQQHGIAVPAPIATYKSGSQIITVQGDGRWEHDDGHEVHTTGTGLQDLKAHLEACTAAKDSLDKTTIGEEPMTEQEVTKIQLMLSRFKLPFTVEHLQRAAKGDGMSVEEEEALAEDMGVEKDAKTKRVAGEDLSASDHLIVGDPEDTSTWKLPWKFSTDAKTKSHLRNALVRFDQLKGVSAEEKASAWKKLVAHCKEYGIEVSDDTSKAEWNDLTVGQILDLEKLTGHVHKGMYDIGVLAGILDALRSLMLSSWYESAYENVSAGGGDEADMAICEALHEHMTGLVDVLKEMVDEETEELLATPALKTMAVIQTTKGEDTSMKHVEELVKAAKGLASHFKAAAAHHLKKAEHHEKAAGHHTEAADLHKGMAEHHKSQKADVGDGFHKAAHAFHKGMHGHHMDKAAHHTAMHKLHKAHGEHCATMATSIDDNADKTMKLAAEDSTDLTKSITDLGTAMNTGIETIKTGFTDAVTKGLEGIPDLVKATVADSKTALIKGAGIEIVPRPGEQIRQQDVSGMNDGESGL